MGRTYDDARAHREHLPGDLPRKAGATHLGMFFAWCALRGLASAWHGRLDPDRLERLKRRELTGRDYVVDYLDGKLEADHLTPDGQAFAERYLASGTYMADYTTAVASGLETPYHVEDAWEVFDRLVPVLDRAYGSVAVVEADAEAEAELEVDAEPASASGSEPEPEPEPAPEPEPDPEPEWDVPLEASDIHEPLPPPEPDDEDDIPPDVGLPTREEEAGTFQEVLRVAGVAGAPTIESEPDVGPPLPAETETSDGDAWTWEETVRRSERDEPGTHGAGGSVPPALPDLDGPERTWRTTAKRVKPKSSGWIWVGLVIFLLLYGCGKAMSRAKQTYDDPMPREFPR